MTTNNIFDHNILSGDLTPSLVPELGQENISLNLTSQQSSFINPLTQEISLTEPEIITKQFENNLDNNSARLYPIKQHK
ncbi:MAG: hypothetical protein AAGE84_31250 [Cyanobacteria bacterium P01_G01_bin.39]